MPFPFFFAFSLFLSRMEKDAYSSLTRRDILFSLFAILAFISQTKEAP